MTLEFEVFLSTTVITNFLHPFNTPLTCRCFLVCFMLFAGPSGGYEKGDNLIFTIYDEDRSDRPPHQREPVEWSKKKCVPKIPTKFCDNRKPFEGLILQGGLSTKFCDNRKLRPFEGLILQGGLSTKFCDNRKLRPFEGLILQGGPSLLSASKVIMIR